METQTQPTRRVSRPPTTSTADGSIELNQDEIRKRAYNIAMARRSFDDYVWLWAEQELRVSKALATPLAPNLKSVKVDATKIVEKPEMADIKKLASDLARYKTKVQDIHWYIAERQYIADKARGIG